MSHRKERGWHISYVHSHPSLAVLVMSKPAAIQIVGCHNRLIEIKSHHTEQQEFKRVTTNMHAFEQQQHSVWHPYESRYLCAECVGLPDVDHQQCKEGFDFQR